MHRYPLFHKWQQNFDFDYRLSYVYKNLDLEKVKNHPDIDGIMKHIKEQELYGLLSIRLK